MKVPRMLPDGKATITIRPNIRPEVQPHKDCWRQEWHSPMGLLGDVRRCMHGRVQILTRISEYASVQGPGTHWWRTISPIWDPVTYRRARKALAG